MLRFWATVTSLPLLFACSRSEGSESDPVIVYQLASVGGRPLSVKCSDEELRASRYEISGSHWLSVDTVFKDCTDSLRPEFTRTRQDSGVFWLHGDTIHFVNPAANVKLGEASEVLMGLLRKDTLVAWGSDEDGGDYVYVRRQR